MFDRMKRKIAFRTAITLGIYLVLFLWLVSPSWWVEFLSDFPTWVETIKWALPFVLGGIALFFVILDAHNWLDRTFFKERRKVDDYIRNQLTTPCRESSCVRDKRGILEDEKHKLMSLFYTFIPPNDTERERAFSYWTDYFTTVYWTAFSILALVGALVAIAFDHSRVTHPAFFIVVALLLLLNFARIRSKKKLLHPAKAQTNRILSQDYHELKRKLPQYRINCQECPLIP